MILVFVIGGVIPFFGVTVYLNNRAANSLIEQNKKAQKQELHLMASILEDAVPDMEKVCENMNINTVLSNMITKDYPMQKHPLLKKIYFQAERYGCTCHYPSSL